MIRFSTKLIAAGAVLLALALPVATARAADVDGAQQFITGLGDRTIAILQRPDLDDATAIAEFGDLFRGSFDIPTIGRFVLGRYWQSATETQRQEYLSLFEQMIVETYARRFTEYSGQTFGITGARPEGERDVKVQSEIRRPDGPPVAVTWRVRDRGGSFEIVDVEVEGVSMGVTQRNEFSAVIQRNGGSIDALLDAMRQQIQSAQTRS